MTHGPVQVFVACDGTSDPALDSAPLHVRVRIGRVTSEQIQQLRRLLHALVTTAPRSIVVDMSATEHEHAAIVFAVIVSGYRKARAAGATIQVASPPESIRRSFAIAGVPEAAPSATAPDDDPAFTLVFESADDAEAVTELAG